MIKALIIEDEPLAQSELKRLLAKIATAIQVIECLDSVEEAVDWFSNKTNKADLVFLDIQLADGISFEIFQQVKITTPVIFTTAYDAFAIKAFELNAIDYLLKPIEEALLQRALDKFNKFHQQHLESEGPSSFFTEAQLQSISALAPKKFKRKFISKIGDQIKQVDADEVAYFFAQDNVVFLVLQNGKKLMVDYTLEHLDVVLDPDIFWRVSRKFIVRESSIVKNHKYFNGRYLLELNPPSEEQCIVSRTRAQEFIQWLDR